MTWKTKVQIEREKFEAKERRIIQDTERRRIAIERDIKLWIQRRIT